jgi:hypothetical protein
MNVTDPCVPVELVPEGSVPRIINGPNNEYQDLPCVITPQPCRLITRWTPTPEERTAVLNGEDIYVTLLIHDSMQTAINPMFVTVGPVDWTKDPDPE